ncbi:MAG: tRNA (N6-threonylcarbamoyladenosine(37)-N6)-methyltransferase TrmO [Candidatus Eisenbacteria bacterium]
MDSIVYRPIGVIRSPHVDGAATPIQPVFAVGIPGRVELEADYAEGLRDLDGFSHLFLIYHFHRAAPARLLARPFLDDQERGVFATRAPARPNPIGISLVRLQRIEGRVLHVEDIDVLDGTPLLDIKPYAPRFDDRRGACSGWLERIDEATAQRQGRREGRQDS